MFTGYPWHVSKLVSRAEAELQAEVAQRQLHIRLHGKLRHFQARSQWQRQECTTFLQRLASVREASAEKAFETKRQNQELRSRLRGLREQKCGRGGVRELNAEAAQRQVEISAVNAQQARLAEELREANGLHRELQRELRDVRELRLRELEARPARAPSQFQAEPVIQEAQDDRDEDEALRTHLAEVGRCAAACGLQLGLEDPDEAEALLARHDRATVPFTSIQRLGAKLRTDT